MLQLILAGCIESFRLKLAASFYPRPCQGPGCLPLPKGEGSGPASPKASSVAPQCWLWSRPTVWAFWHGLRAVTSLQTGEAVHIPGLCLIPVAVSRPDPTLMCCSASWLLLAEVRTPASHITSPGSLPAYLEEQPALAAPWWCWPSLILRGWQYYRKPPCKPMEVRSYVIKMARLLEQMKCLKER